MTYKQARFIAYYVNPDSPSTFGNGTQSYLKAYPNASYATAMREASRNLRKPHIQKEIECFSLANGLDTQVRLRALADIVKSPNIGITVTEIYPETGKRITKSGPKPSDVIKVIDMINRACGLY